MGKEFGALATIRGIIYYKLSPFEQRPMAKLVSVGVKNVFVRTSDRFLLWAPQFVLSYLIFISCEAAHRNSKRKDPKDYMDEVDPNPPVKKCEKKEKKE